MTERAATVTVAVAVAVLACVNAAAIVYAHRQNGDLRGQQVESCERGNALRAQVNRLAATAGLPPLRLVDCDLIGR